MIQSTPDYPTSDYPVAPFIRSKWIGPHRSVFISIVICPDYPTFDYPVAPIIRPKSPCPSLGRLRINRPSETKCIALQFVHVCLA